MKTIMMAGLVALAVTACATEFHVGVNGNDADAGSQAKPLRTIQHAADLAQPGDVITVHAGVYRERINPPRGGASDAKRIVYRAAPGEAVEITGSEIVKSWVKVRDDIQNDVRGDVQNDTWKATLPNAFFGGFNPYGDLIHGDWFVDKGRQHHTGAVYLNGDWLVEAAKQEDVQKPVGRTPLWFGTVDTNSTTIWAQFKGVNPNEQPVEINVRQTVFYPDKPGRNYITVRGFTLCNAATPWAPPTAEQMGLIGTHWSKGWIIESNTISHSVCSGVALGKYGDQWDNRAGSADGYNGTINRALSNGWNQATIGSHIVRNNTISQCEQTGIVGSLGAVFSRITGNSIHDIHVRGLFFGYEMAGIKIHGAVDVEISHNHIYRTCIGIWLDWMAQGTRVSGNLLHDNGRSIFFEVDHGPFLVDNNIILGSPIESWSQGGAFVHNLIVGGRREGSFDGRKTPFFKAHSTEMAGLRNILCGDDRFYNNIFVSGGPAKQYDAAKLPSWMSGNVFLKNAEPSKIEIAPLLKQTFDPQLKLVEKSDGFYLEVTFDKAWRDEQAHKLVITELLGKAAIPNVSYENPDGSPLKINTDYFGKPRDETNPTPGPFENPGTGLLHLKVW